MVYLVAYESDALRQTVVDEIQTFREWTHLTSSVYAIRTDMSVGQVFNKVKGHLQAGDRLYVFRLSEHYAGFGPLGVNDWLDEHL